ncbi:MAG: lipopolysaccharide assembly protein LapB [Wenzhouxiangellaceae bacterium]|nr:lipopolysaccharide assembly protein LapB [Wenzhouxiangellaceae bacterium]
MPDPVWATVAMLPVAAWLGWLLAMRRRQTEGRRRRNAISSEYFRGLNYLLNEQPDRAIEVFLELADVNEQTVETHLALGSLFRRRGEVDKAIHYHRHIMTRPDLTEQHRTQALLELGEDYMRAGLLDRAEKLFSDLAAEGRQSETAVRNLLTIYQQEKDWKNAILQARALERITGEDTAPLIAQFHCELAAAELAAGRPEHVAQHLQSARARRSDCARADLIEAEAAVACEQWREAAGAYLRACRRDPELAAIAVEPLLECYRRLDEPPELLAELESLAAGGGSITALLALAELRAAAGEPSRAIDELLAALQQRPTVRGLYRLLDLMREHDRSLDALDSEPVRALMKRLLSDRPRFRCRECGFGGSTWHWQCPSCRRWETTRPVTGVLGS